MQVTFKSHEISLRKSTWDWGNMLEHLLCLIWLKECALHNPTYAIFIFHFTLVNV